MPFRASLGGEFEYFWGRDGRFITTFVIHTRPNVCLLDFSKKAHFFVFFLYTPPSDIMDRLGMVNGEDEAKAIKINYSSQID